MARQVDRIEIPPMTPERAERMRAALERADEFRKNLLEKRSAQRFRPVSEDIAAIREERERELS